MEVDPRRLLYLAVIGILIGVCESLKDVRVSIPLAIKRGEMAVLVCHYDLEDDSLYSVKWYKGSREFYRFTPKEDPFMKIFPIFNLNVLASASNATQVTLTRVELTVSGRYSCEVSVDAPSFHTALVSGNMDIVEIPNIVPVISGLKQRYRVGDLLQGNCTSSWSKPAANLTWIINGEQAPSNLTIPYPILKEKGGDREYSRFGLRLPITSHLFPGGRLKIRCSASIHTIYWKTTEKSVEEERPRGVGMNGGGGTHQLQPVTTEQPASGYKFGNDESDDEQVDIKSISGLAARYSMSWSMLALPIGSTAILLARR